MENNDHMYYVHYAKKFVQPNKTCCINCDKSKQKLTIKSTHKNDTSNIIDCCKEQWNRNTCIDDVFNRNNLYRLQAFSYSPGDFLFDTLQVLLHFFYSFMEL
jgi:hypothetical protein